jgi:arginine:ornithine antiporter/lysine permease
MALELTSAMTLIPYLLVAAYALKLALTQETYEQDASRRIPEMIISLVATVYAILMLVAGGLEKLLLAGLILAPGTILFFISRRQQGLRVFGFWELVLFTVSVIAALSALYGLGTGLITI